MPTVIQDVPAAWTEIQTGPIESISIQPFSGGVIYALSSSVPAATAEGHTIQTTQGHTIALDTGENLYARSQSFNTAKLAVTT